MMQYLNRIKLIAFIWSLGLYSCVPAPVSDQSGAVTASATQPQIVSPTGVGGLSSLNAFQSTVYPIATVHCTSCHIASNQPFFANGDLQTAYDSLLNSGKVNLQNPGSSRLVLRLSQDKHNCWSDCTANAQQMQAAIAQWQALISTTTTATATTSSTSTQSSTATSTSSGSRFNTLNLIIPATIPASNGNAAANFSTLTWLLDANGVTINPKIAKAILSVEIQQFDNFSYRIRNPKIITPSSSIYLNDLRFSINGSIRSNDSTYSLLDQTIAMGNAGTILSPAAMIMLIDKGRGVDQLAASFSQIKSASAVSTGAACKNLAGFQSAVKPVMQSSCIRCHNSGNKFDMSSGTDAMICLRSLSRINLTTPEKSNLIVLPKTGSNHSGGGNLIDQTTANNWINWINSER